MNLKVLQAFLKLLLQISNLTQEIIDIHRLIFLPCFLLKRVHKIK